MQDRFGLGWREDLAAGILTNLDRIGVLEVIADDYFRAPRRKVQALRTLAGQHPVMLHAVGCGMASTIRTDQKRLDSMARLVDQVRPESWSEHLAFVRAGGIEIGHLAAPPRNPASIEGTLRNLERAHRTVGLPPAMENVASFINPPGSVMDEASWLNAVLRDCPIPLLLDLHNVYTNSINFGYDPYAMLGALHLDRVTTIHLAGGKWVGKRMLDDHLHDVPDPVYDMLRFVATRTTQPLTVILERDGAYPSISELLAQLDRARDAVAAGRSDAAAA